MDEPGTMEPWDPIDNDPINRPTSAPPVMELTDLQGKPATGHPSSSPSMLNNGQQFSMVDTAYYAHAGGQDPSYPYYMDPMSQIGRPMPHPNSVTMNKDDYSPSINQDSYPSVHHPSIPNGSVYGQPPMMSGSYAMPMHPGAGPQSSGAPQHPMGPFMHPYAHAPHSTNHHAMRGGNMMPANNSHYYHMYMADMFQRASPTSHMNGSHHPHNANNGMPTQMSVPSGYYPYFQQDIPMYAYSGSPTPYTSVSPTNGSNAHILPHGRAHSTGGVVTRPAGQNNSLDDSQFGLRTGPLMAGSSPVNTSKSPSLYHGPNGEMNMNKGDSWSKSSPRNRSKPRSGGGRSSGGGIADNPLSSSTDDLLALVSKQHLVKDSLEFTGSMSELPTMSASPRSPRSPQTNRKPIKMQNNNHPQARINSTANGYYAQPPHGIPQQETSGSVPGAMAPFMLDSHLDNSSSGSSLNTWGVPASNDIFGVAMSPTPSNESSPSNINSGINALALGRSSPVPSNASYPEFIMGSGSPIVSHVHYRNSNFMNVQIAPGSNLIPSTTSASINTGTSNSICHYYLNGTCAKGDKCRFAHRSPDEGIVSILAAAATDGVTSLSNGRRTPRAPSSSLSPPSIPPILNTSPTGSQHASPVGASNLVLLESPLLSQQPLPVGTTNLSSNLTTPGNNVNNNHGIQSTQSASNLSVSSPARYANMTIDECVGQVYQMCKDQYGCRYLQKKLDEDKSSTTCDVIFAEILEQIVELMSDPFGNYLCQKLIEKCSTTQRLAIVKGVSTQLVAISKNMHGTRAVQKTIEQLGSPEEIRLIRDSLKGSVVALIQDLNGNHVIQKCIHRLEPNDNQFIYDAVAHHCVQVATHRHGCCVMQRCIDHSSNQQKLQLVDEIKNNALSLVQDQFGNYVVQYVLDLGNESVCEALASNLLGHLYFLSTQKFSSNVVEKCLKVGNAATVKMIAKELAEYQSDPNHPIFPATPKDDPLICLLQHPFGNYVVQTALQVSQTKAAKEWNGIAARIKPHLPNLRTNTYVKRVQMLLSQPPHKSPTDPSFEATSSTTPGAAELFETTSTSVNNGAATPSSHSSNTPQHHSSHGRYSQSSSNPSTPSDGLGESGTHSQSLHHQSHSHGSRSSGHKSQQHRHTKERSHGRSQNGDGNRNHSK